MRKNLFDKILFICFKIEKEKDFNEDLEQEPPLMQLHFKPILSAFFFLSQVSGYSCERQKLLVSNPFGAIFAP